MLAGTARRAQRRIFADVRANFGGRAIGSAGARSGSLLQQAGTLSRVENSLPDAGLPGQPSVSRTSPYRTDLRRIEPAIDGRAVSKGGGEPGRAIASNGGGAGSRGARGRCGSLPSEV